MTMPTALAPTPAPLPTTMPATAAAAATDPAEALPHTGPARAARRAAAPGTALVAGAAGFVGSHLCERLVQAGWSVIALDDLSTGAAVHLAPLQAHPRFRFVRHDITAPLPDAVRAVDRIYNLACPASPAYYQRHPVKTVLASTLGTWNLAQLALERGARLLHVSTSEVYGDPQVHPQPERYWGHVNPVGPRACYDEGKRCAEALLTSAQRERGLDLRIARLFNSYGPRLRAGDGRVVSNFVVQALAGEPLTVYGDGTQTRSFCFVDDTVDGLLALMDSDLDTPVNIGNPDEHTMLGLAAQVIAATGSRSTLVFRPLPVDDPVRRRPDIALAKRRLGWAPQVPLAQGLARTVAWFRSGAAQEAA